MELTVLDYWFAYAFPAFKQTNMQNDEELDKDKVLTDSYSLIIFAFSTCIKMCVVLVHYM